MIERINLEPGGSRKLMVVLRGHPSLVVDGQASREKEVLLKAASFPSAWPGTSACW